tara:strand:- start:7678 stop:8169 length:492 start_codon:yes stop_codon:yes gene_type:complete
METNPIDSMLPIIVEAVQSWRGKNMASSLTQQVHSTLDKEAKQIVLKLLGFDTNYSSYMLDHCNGRSGNSTAGDYIAGVQKEAVRNWLASVPMPELTDEERTTLSASMRQEYISKFRREVLQQANNKAIADAKELVNKISESLTIDSYVKLRDLISSKEESNE